MSPKPWKPTREQLAAAVRKTVPDLIAPELKVLFAGINPGLYTAAIGHHFGRPGNRFWPALYASGFTPRVFSPFEERELLPLGYGITNVVPRTTVAADELSIEEIIAGAKRLEAKVRKYNPRVLAVLGVGAYRTGFSRPKARVGRQEQTIGDTSIWVLPSPSGLNAHHRAEQIAEVFRSLRRSLGDVR